MQMLLLLMILNTIFQSSLCCNFTSYFDGGLRNPKLSAIQVRSWHHDSIQKFLTENHTSRVLAHPRVIDWHQFWLGFGDGDLPEDLDDDDYLSD